MEFNPGDLLADLNYKYKTFSVENRSGKLKGVQWCFRNRCVYGNLLIKKVKQKISICNDRYQ